MYYAAVDKFRRLKRAYHQLKGVYTNTGNGVADYQAKDAAEEFFVQCHHFKDWLKKDNAVSVVSNVEKYITKSKGLALAADICNSFKHAGLDRDSRSKKTIEMMNTHMKLDLVPDKSRFIGSCRLEFTIDGAKYDALDLATLCMAEWQAFLTQDNITLPDP